ncbi:MAG TPA: nickel pincer cofactor biosynthesis protein LarC [Blastocatellia bacterium]|nr:nickel pincer cofactor biosynthesis protein LarC [Blastocatellia bacterium]
MSRTLYLDCFAGASGDMFIGALLDCGLDFNHLRGELAKLGVEGYELSLTRVDRSGISASKFDVLLTGEKPSAGHHHHHDHHHDHHDHAHRSLSGIQRLIQSAGLEPRVKERALTIFQRLGEAEAKIHNVPIEAVHFHEVGAIDSIIDIVGACIGLDALQIDRIISSPIHVGYGTFKCEHGTYPVPGPATIELLKGAPIYAKEIEGELLTPTGAAIISTLASGYGHLPLMRTERIGYGAGTRTYPKFPNVLRAVIGRLEEDADRTPSAVTVIEANVDDLSAQIFGHLMEKTLAAGALEIFYTPVQMKKNRPGVLLTLLCRPEDRERMTGIIFRETTTLGVRFYQAQREILPREYLTVETGYGPIRIKVARAQDGQVINSSPEFEDCRAAAEKNQVPLREVQMAAMRAYSTPQSI